MKQTNGILWYCKLGDNSMCQVQCDGCKKETTLDDADNILRTGIEAEYNFLTSVSTLDLEEEIQELVSNNFWNLIKSDEEE